MKGTGTPHTAQLCQLLGQGMGIVAPLEPFPSSDIPHLASEFLLVNPSVSWAAVGFWFLVFFHPLFVQPALEDAGKVPPEGSQRD